MNLVYLKSAGKVNRLSTYKQKTGVATNAMAENIKIVYL